MSHEIVDVGQWPRAHDDQRHPMWWGIMGLIIIESTVLLGFVVSYFYLWIVNMAEGKAGWPPAGTQLPPLLYPTMDCVLLLFCAYTMWHGGIVMNRGNNRFFNWLIIACTIASILVFYFRIKQFMILPFTHNENAYASFVWFLTGFHFFHVLATLLGTLVIGVLSYKGYFHPKRLLGVKIDTFYWYFVVAGWFPVYFIVYLLPRMVNHE